MKGLNRIYFKACPKCRGDMYLDSDVYGAFGKCLQCGSIYELAVSRVQAAQAKTDKVRTGKLAA